MAKTIVTTPRIPAADGNSHWLVRWTAALTIATFVLAILSGVADIFIYGQWRAAADAQNDTRKQLAASVTFLGGQIQILDDDKHNTINYTFIPRFRNWGSTRTGYFSAWASIKYFDKEIPNSQDFSKPYDKVKFDAIILGPNDTGGVAVSLPVTDAIKAKNKEGTVVIWGHAEYSDIYSKDINNIQFCIKLIPVSSDGDNRIVFQPTPLKEDCNTGMPRAPT